MEGFPDLYHDRWQLETAIGDVERPGLRGGPDVVLRSRLPTGDNYREALLPSSRQRPRSGTADKTALRRRATRHSRLPAGHGVDGLKRAGAIASIRLLADVGTPRSMVERLTGKHAIEGLQHQCKLIFGDAERRPQSNRTGGAGQRKNVVLEP